MSFHSVLSPSRFFAQWSLVRQNRDSLKICSMTFLSSHRSIGVTVLLPRIGRAVHKRNDIPPAPKACIYTEAPRCSRKLAAFGHAKACTTNVSRHPAPAAVLERNDIPSAPKACIYAEAPRCSRKVRHAKACTTNVSRHPAPAAVHERNKIPPAPKACIYAEAHRAPVKLGTLKRALRTFYPAGRWLYPASMHTTRERAIRLYLHRSFSSLK